MTDALPSPRTDPIPGKFRAAFAEMFLKDLTNRIAESNRIALAVSDILSETGMVIHAMPFPAGSYRERTMLMHEIRREGWTCDAGSAAQPRERR